jgi:hypothetical protein
MDYFPRKSLSKYLTDTIDFNKHVHDINIFINDKGRKYASRRHFGKRTQCGTVLWEMLTEATFNKINF